MDSDHIVNSVSFEVGTLIANSGWIPVQSYTSGHIHVPSGETATLTFYVAVEDTDDAVYSLVTKEDGSALATGSIAGPKSVPLHSALVGAVRLKVLASAISGGTSVAYRATLKG